MNFSFSIINWYNTNKRDLPWRKTRDPYKIWLSEIILQQTRVNQGLPYYNSFINNFPTIFDLANASENKVLKLWQGLGYYSRARNLHFTSKYICANFDGKFPDNFNEIISLKGIGVYTASAICSFAFKERYAVVDGNVIRVLSRVFGVYSFYDTANGKKDFFELADIKLPGENSDTYNQAIMEFGALICKPKKPDCLNCVFIDCCYAFNKNVINELPRKSRKLKVKNRHINFLIITHHESIYMIKKQKGIWAGLYEFPSIEFNEGYANEEIISSNSWLDFFNKELVNIDYVSPVIIHHLSHQKLHVKFWHIRCDSLKNLGYKSIKISKINKIPVSRLIDNYLAHNIIC
jgi:A/G-specific adenine glycosylase